MYNWSLYDETLGHSDLGVDDTAGRCAQPDVVKEGNKLDVQDVTFPQPAHADTSSILQIPVQSRLRPVRRIVVDDSTLRRRGTDVLSERLGFAGEFSKALLHLFERRCGLFDKLDRDAGEMAIDDGYSVTVGRDFERARSVIVEPLLVLVDAPQDLGSLPFDLFFLAADMGDDVIQDVEG